MNRQLLRLRLGLLVLAGCLGTAALAQSNPDRFKLPMLEYNSTARVQHRVPLLYANLDTEAGPPWPMQVLLTYYQPNGRYGESQWKYTYCHTVDWLVDGKVMRLGPVKYSQMEQPDRRIEFISQPVTLEQLRQLGNAKKIEYRLCKDEHEISSEDIDGLRDLAERSAQFLAEHS